MAPYLCVHLQAFNGSMVYWFNSSSYYDDLAWAAAWLWKATGDPGYESDAFTFWIAHRDSDEGNFDKNYLVSLHTNTGKILLSDFVFTMAKLA